MRKYRITHRTTYRYDAPMTDGYTVACLVPRPTPWQRVLASRVELQPTASESDSYLDVFGNLVYQFGFHEPHQEMTVEAFSSVEIDERDTPVDGTPWESVVAELDGLGGSDAIDIGFFRARSTFVDTAALADQLRELTATTFTPGRGIVDATRALCELIYRDFQFDAGFSDVSTPLGQVLSARRGVCQDFAQLAVACLRSLGLAARYVSGYIETLPPPGQQRLVGADASHAWSSVWTPSAGWVDFDPTNGHLPANDHVTVAWGRDYADVTPVRGVMIGPRASQTLDVSVDVARIGETPTTPV